MDNISKVILTVIAAALCAITVKLYSTSGSFSGVNGAPTFGDLKALNNIKDPEQRSEAHQKLMLSLPLVRVQGVVNINN